LPNWIRSGKETVNDKLINKAQEILKTHQPEPLPPELKKDLDKIWDDAKKKKRT
jgi:trimethylamine:corrinoid methyltransferase-like protein